MVAILSALLELVGFMATAVIIRGIYKETVTVSDALKKALSKWFMALLTLIVFIFAFSLLVALPLLSLLFTRMLPVLLQFLFLIIALALFVFPIRYYVYWSFLLYAVLFNDKYVGDALSYSKMVVKAGGGKYFFILLLLRLSPTS